jgi:hypothetical protein
LPIPSLDPVVPDHGPRRTILEIISQTILPKRTEPVELKDDPIRLSVVVVLVDAVLDAVIENPATFDQEIGREVS